MQPECNDFVAATQHLFTIYQGNYFHKAVQSSEILTLPLATSFVSSVSFSKFGSTSRAGLQVKLETTVYISYHTQAAFRVRKWVLQKWAAQTPSFNSPYFSVKFWSIPLHM